jgi:lysyl-tRNA synthetase class 2
LPDFAPQFESEFEEKFYNERREKLRRIAETGHPLYPNSFAFTHTLTQLADPFPALLPLGLHPDGTPKSAEELETEPIEAAVAGRIIAIRLQGKAGFATLLQNGARLQIYVRKDDVGETAFDLYKLLDLGDHIGARGSLMRTRTGELTLKLHAIAPPSPAAGPALELLTKAMLPLPDKYAGLGDIELRYRRRYLDLFTDTGDVAKAATDEATTALSRLPAREVFVKRAAVLRAIRHFFDSRGYLEVETPMLHTIAGGAAARPFNTHHNALDMPLHLRIAPELYLKRLVVGGLDRVYEINRNFRNEGVSTQHNPEFTMLEFYQAYANYHDLMDLTIELITTVAKEVNGTTLTNFNGTDIDLSTWTKLSMREAIIKWWPRFLNTPPILADFQNAAAFRSLLERTAVQANSQLGPNFDERMLAGLCSTQLDDLDNGRHYGRLISELFEWVAERKLIEPTIIYDFPLAVSPLSKVKPDEPTGSSASSSTSAASK